MSESKTVDFSEFFRLSDVLANQPLRVAPVNRQKWATEKVSNLFCENWQPPEPVILVPDMGGRATDFLWSTLPPYLCVSQRVVDLLLDNRFTGWGTYPVEVYDRKGNYLPGYHGFAIKSFAGIRDLNRSEVIWRPYFPGHAGGLKKYFKGLYFHEELWDGSDFFRVTEWTIIVTRRVAEVFKKAKIRNVKLEVLPEIESIESLFTALDGKIKAKYNYIEKG